ncbi:MAG: GNAT family N-acetyltransferase [Desulfuromonadaceae bacterium]|nr:GNAT family N-acetyltransferase [Desulfuromonadaceae bacterium]
MFPYNIRNAREEEFSAVNVLTADAWQVLKAGYDPAQWDGMIAAVGSMANLASNGELIVTEDHGRDVGAVCYMPPNASNPDMYPEGWPTVRMLVTHPNYRGKGIGRRLTEECIRRARRDRADCIGLHTSPVMSVALPLYLRMGFVMDKELSLIAGAPYARYVLKF